MPKTYITNYVFTELLYFLQCPYLCLNFYLPLLVRATILSWKHYMEMICLVFLKKIPFHAMRNSVCIFSCFLVFFQNQYFLYCITWRKFVFVIVCSVLNTRHHYFTWISCKIEKNILLQKFVSTWSWNRLLLPAVATIYMEQWRGEKLGSHFVLGAYSCLSASMIFRTCEVAGLVDYLWFWIAIWSIAIISWFSFCFILFNDASFLEFWRYVTW